MIFPLKFFRYQIFFGGQIFDDTIRIFYLLINQILGVSRNVDFIISLIYNSISLKISVFETKHILI